MKLESLKVGNNAFLNIPNSVVKKGQKAVTKYFEEFHQETRNCCKIKLMVVGQENVGKSILSFILFLVL
jgi:tRNA U34 5-carboxymethylaminomethyl modifying GTPase MnmE/TrmE